MKTKTRNQARDNRKVDIGFGRRLKEVRQRRKMTQEQLGSLMNTSKQVVSSWEKPRTEPTLAQLAELCDHLRTTADYLIRGVHPLTREQREALRQAIDV